MKDIEPNNSARFVVFILAEKQVTLFSIISSLFLVVSLF